MTARRAQWRPPDDIDTKPVANVDMQGLCDAFGVTPNVVTSITLYPQWAKVRVQLLNDDGKKYVLCPAGQVVKLGRCGCPDDVQHDVNGPPCVLAEEDRVFRLNYSTDIPTEEKVPE